jgi:hypothetical protein
MLLLVSPVDNAQKTGACRYGNDAFSAHFSM